MRKYSDASSTEVGTLLMVLPFSAVFTKPFFCALADRHRRYRLYFILGLLFTLLGFGSYTFLPFFPQFVTEHGRTAWYLLVVFTVIGYTAFGVVWSLGDAYAANVSHRTGESFGLIRLWGTIGWGVAGAAVGAISPYLELPEMVLGFLIFIGSLVFEIIVLSFWPHREDFEMGDSHVPAHKSIEKKRASLPPTRGINQLATICEKPETTKTSPAADQQDTLMFAMSQLKSGQLTIKRTESNSLDIITRVKLSGADCKVIDKLDRTISELVRASDKMAADVERAYERKKIANLQMTIFRMVARKHKSLIKYLVLYVIMGAIYNIHSSYFFLHLERLAHEGKGGDFSTLVGMCLVAQAVGETFCFAIAPWVVRKLGRDGSISLNALAYGFRYFGNGLGIPLISPYVAILTESLQGINYGIFYYLITDTALHYVQLVDEVIPELIEKRLIDKSADMSQVRSTLRATMQGVFSGAFDGLGFGLGSIIAGLVLETHDYEELWCYSGAGALVFLLLHGFYELTSRVLRDGGQSSSDDLRKKGDKSYAAEIAWEPNDYYATHYIAEKDH